MRGHRNKDIKCRSSRPFVFLGKGILKMCGKSTGKHPCQNPISIKLLCNFIEIALRHGCSLVNLLYISRTSFLRTWLLLAILTNPQFPATLFILRNVHWKTCSICTRFLSYQIIYWSILSRFVINCSPMETDILSDRSEIREGYAVKSFFQSISWNMKNFHEILLL